MKKNIFPIRVAPAPKEKTELMKHEIFHNAMAKKLTT